MPTYNAEETTIPVRSNYWENCNCDRRYKDYYRFNQDQYYEGDFFRDSFHGQGAYTWKNVGVYEGSFYSNSKEGYSCLSLADNSYFEGLFVKNQPFGPGILTYANGRQDAGFWRGRKLIRLSRAVDYIIPRLAPTRAAKIKLLQFKRLLPLPENSDDSTTDMLDKLGCQSICFPSPYSSVIYDPRSVFFDKKIFEKVFFINELTDDFIKDAKYLENGIRESVELFGEQEESDDLEEARIPSHCLCQQDVFEMNYENKDEEDICEKESAKGELEIGILGYFTKFGTIEGLEENVEVEENQVLQDEGESDDVSKCPKILLWNRSSLCKEIIKQMFRYRGFEDKLNFNLAKLILGARTAFRRTGEREKQCLQLLKMCSLGPPHAVNDLICSYEISQDLMDGRGNNSVMFAAAADQHEIIDILLDYGVDVNNFNDEGLTPLNLCLLRRLALTNKISSWETAFLPQEIDTNLIPEDFPKDEMRSLQSIQSLDRIFGDGMSVHDSKTFSNKPQIPALLSTVSISNELHENFKNQKLMEYSDIFNKSEVSIFNMLKSATNFSVVFEGDKNKQDAQTLDSFCSFNTIDPMQEIKSNDTTLKLTFVPESIKRDEFQKSVQKLSTDRYLFEFTFKKKPMAIVGGSKKEKEANAKSSKSKSNKGQENKEEDKKEEIKNTEIEDLELNIKVQEIDKTIEKLLERGADPNISDVPKPSIHLGIHTRDLQTICTLLSHGASPNSQLYANEGLLTPLHVIVLLEPDLNNLQICEILLNFGADPELETAPEFSISEEEKSLLASDCGRTPLQLLCMRPDLEFADPYDYLIKIGLLLADASNKRHFYNGHNCLTLAMLSGNLKILCALLECKCFDPNDILGNDRGTTLHVLVSTELQRITPYENSIRMCDLLIANGADPLIKFKSPEILLGTCVDYGFREIQAEKEARKTNKPVKKDSKSSKGKEKSAVKDYLKDHERVVEYLCDIATNMAKSKEKDNKLTKKIKIQNQEDVFAKGKVKDKNKGREISLRESEEKNEILSPDKNEKKKHSSEGEKAKKDLSGRLETAEKKQPEDTEKKEKERKAKKESISLEDREIQKEKKKKEKDVDTEKNDKKPKSQEKKDSQVIKKKDKSKTGSFSADKNSVKNRQKIICSKSQGGRSETFPENLRQIFLRMYGTGFEFDVNKLLVPYVVLRNGELYYRFHKKSQCQKEQYSLI